MKKYFFLSVFALLSLMFSGQAQEVFKNSALTVSLLDKGVWVIETTDMTTMYIVEGTNRALLIDTGTNCEALDEVVRKITSKPFDVVVLHNHPDHAGNIRYFDEVYMHSLDTTVRLGNSVFNGKYIWLKDGDVFDLGNRKIEVIWTPGHTPGSIVLLDPAINACYTSDSFGSGQVWMQLEPFVPMKTYYESCVRMEKIMREQNITKIYCGHYPYVKQALPIDYIVDMKELAKRLSEGDTSGSKPYQMPFRINGTPASVTLRSATIVFNSEKIN